MGSFLQLVSKPVVIITAVNVAANPIDFFNISSSCPRLVPARFDSFLRFAKPLFVFHYVEGYPALLS